MNPQLTEYELGALRALPATEPGKVFFRLLQMEIEQEEEAFDFNAKICDDPLSEDFRWKKGEIKGLKRAMKLPEKYTNIQQ